MKSYHFEHAIVTDSNIFEYLGIAKVLGHSNCFRRISTVTDFNQIEQEIESETGIILLASDVAGLHTPDQVITLRDTYQGIKVVVLSGRSNSNELLKLLDAGIHGFIPKRVEQKELIAAIRMVAGGHIYLPADIWEEVALARALNEENVEENLHLSPRQEEVLTLASEGLSNKEIATRLDISESTVKVHMAAVLRTLRVSSRGRAVAMLKAMKEPELFGWEDLRKRTH